MRHNKKFNHLGRQAAHRGSMLANMAVSLIKYKKINTTLAKAKELRKFIEPLITKSKEDTTHSRRVVFQELQNKEAVTLLFGDIANRVADRPGGYTRILKTGFRLGDAAQMCFIELVDYNENMLKAKSEKKAAKTRRGGKKSTAKAEVVEATPVEAAPVEEAPKAEAPKNAEAPKKAEEPKAE
ncbi:MAG: 50S ribosomal protein L17 [Paludibacteraceae bacterium]|nr:50S ribosomal protein L17 [Paludibacteraceae bacterium]